MLNMRRDLFLIALLLVLAVVPNAFAQATTSLRGTVIDPSGAVIPEAIATLRALGNGSKRQVPTGADGVYQFLQVTPGTYQVVLKKPGFAKISRDGVQLLVNTPATIDFHMEIGNTGDVVNVLAEAAEINTVDASIGNTFSEPQVRQPPFEH